MTVSRSSIEFCRTATMTPIGIASAHEKIMLASESITVLTARDPINPVTLTRYASETPRFRCTTSHSHRA